MSRLSRIHPVYQLSKKLDEEVARLHLEKIGVKLTTRTESQSSYMGIPQEGPYDMGSWRAQ
jgi:adenosylhomocysteinase